MRPLLDNVIIEPVNDEKENKSGLILIDKPEETKKGRVLSIGSKVNDVKVNDIILYDYGISVKDHEIEYFLVKEENIIAIYE
jgi:co-chaperonin GroES (HSP10)